MKIELKNIYKNFDGIPIIKNVNLKLEQGNIYGFIGSNGSGKSVLFKMICGLYKPTSGSIIIDDLDITFKDCFVDSMRVLIEKPNFISSMSGFENLKLLASIQNKIGEKEILKALADVNLLNEKDKKYHKYSLGMKQKLGIAQVLMEDPKIIILDEPLNGIEEKTALKIRDLLIMEKEKGKLILIASHIKEDIYGLANIIYKIDDGEINKID